MQNWNLGFSVIQRKRKLISLFFFKIGKSYPILVIELSLLYSRRAQTVHASFRVCASCPPTKKNTTYYHWLMQDLAPRAPTSHHHHHHPPPVLKIRMHINKLVSMKTDCFNPWTFCRYLHLTSISKPPPYPIPPPKKKKEKKTNTNLPIFWKSLFIDFTCR